MLEQEVTDLKTKLKNSEKKNVELINDMLCRDIESTKEVRQSNCDDSDGAEQIMDLCRTLKGNKSCRSRRASVPKNESRPKMSFPSISRDQNLTTSNESLPSCCHQSSSKEIYGLLLLVFVFLIVFFLKALHPVNGCFLGTGCSGADT